MKVLNEIVKAMTACVVWILAFLLLAVIDDAVGNWITDHEITRIMLQAIIQGVAVIALLYTKARFITAISVNIIILSITWIVSDVGMAQSFGIIMMLGIIPVYLREKGGE